MLTMADLDETSAPASARAGSSADLARRMDRMETRQDTMESKVTELATLVARVEQNQNHTAELNKLRFDALDAGVKQQTGLLAQFIARIDSLLTGETQTVQTKNALQDYNAFRQSTTDRLDAIELRSTKIDARSTGVLAVFGGTKAIILVVAAIASPVITIIALILSQQK